MNAYRAMKRVIDITGAVCGLAVFSPLMIWAAFKIARENSGKIIFRQERAGLNGAPFTLYKFRSMTDARDERGEPLPDAERLTPFGRWLRSTSLDELPQLLNVLRGDMSLVGPRPLLLEYVPLYDETERLRLSAPPGITGWAQINGRNGISWPEKFALDIWYVKNASLALDVKILLLTVKRALAREGISAGGEATMPRFTGERRHG
jgi:lipopolysaccharide/colanic/teichoic acid biosynthesis glycosyltransferase